MLESILPIVYVFVCLSILIAMWIYIIKDLAQIRVAQKLEIEIMLRMNKEFLDKYDDKGGKK